ncbi:hypothetical protein ACIPLC_37385 [Kitasatospora sp. NPDC086801]
MSSPCEVADTGASQAQQERVLVNALQEHYSRTAATAPMALSVEFNSMN